MANKAPTSTEIRNLVQAQNETAKELSERLVRIENLVNKQETRNDKQESRNQNALYAVIIAFLFILITVAAEVLLSNKHDSSIYQDITNQINLVDDKVEDVKLQNLDNAHTLELLRARNTYLK